MNLNGTKRQVYSELSSPHYGFVDHIQIYRINCGTLACSNLRNKLSRVVLSMTYKSTGKMAKYLVVSTNIIIYNIQEIVKETKSTYSWDTTDISINS